MNWKLRRPEGYVVLCFLGFVLLTASCVLYSGPFTKTYRSLFGDLFGIIFVYYGWRLVIPYSCRIWALLLSAIMAYGVELLQWFEPQFSNEIAHFLLGSVFDWKDVLMYTIGMGVAYWMDRTLKAKQNESA